MLRYSQKSYFEQETNETYAFPSLITSPLARSTINLYPGPRPDSGTSIQHKTSPYIGEQIHNGHVQVYIDKPATLAFRREIRLRRKIGQSLWLSGDNQRYIRVSRVLLNSWLHDGQRTGKQATSMFDFLACKQHLIRSFPFLAHRGGVVNLHWIVPLALAVIGALFFLYRTIMPFLLSGIGTSPGGMLPVDSYFLLHGMLVGLSIAAPIGPMSIVCMQRTVSKGSMYGFASGLGNSVAIALYGALAAFGMTAITTFLVHQEVVIHLIGGLFLLYLGLKAVFSRPAEQVLSVVSRSIGGEILSSFLLSLVNPMTIVLFAAAFTSIGLGGTQSNGSSTLLVVLGVFWGSILWWGLLISGISLLRSKLLRNTGWMVWINRISGGILTFLGATSFLSLISSVFP